MRMFNLKEVVLSLTSQNLTSLLNSIELYKGKTLSAWKLRKVSKLKALARKYDVISSNSVGNVFLSEEREKDIFVKGKPAETFDEHMIIGYQNALNLIDEVYKYQPFDRSFISTLHYYIYKDYNPEFGGKFKDTQNYIQEVQPDGSLKTVFVPAAPEEVVPLLENLIYQFNECMLDENTNKLVAIFVFLLDFICIHPYNHGNGRLGRLILYFLLKKYGYNINDYFSTSYLVKQRLSTYIDALELSMKGWNENENDYSHYVNFMLKIVLEAYHKLDYIMEVLDTKGTTITRVYKIVVDSVTPISKNVVCNVLYGTSTETIEKALAQLVKEGKIQLISRGRYSKYFRT